VATGGWVVPAKPLGYSVQVSSRPDLHNLADARSWALHQAVASLLTERPDLIERARGRVAAWLSEPSGHPYATDWKALLEGKLEDLQAALLSTGPRMCTLRTASPFAGALDNRTRWRILKRAELRVP